MSDITIHKPKASWQAKNPVLPNGTFGFEEETGKVKQGDGVRRWLVLPYLSVPPYTLPPFPEFPEGLPTYLTMDGLRAEFAHLENGVLVIAGQPVGGQPGSGGGMAGPVPDPIDPDLYVFATGALVPDSTDPDLYVFPTGA